MTQETGSSLSEVRAEMLLDQIQLAFRIGQETENGFKIGQEAMAIFLDPLFKMHVIHRGIIWEILDDDPNYGKCVIVRDLETSYSGKVPISLLLESDEIKWNVARYAHDSAMSSFRGWLSVSETNTVERKVLKECYVGAITAIYHLFYGPDVKIDWGDLFE